MNYDTLKSVKAVCLVPLAALCFMTSSLAETTPAKTPPASMPHEHMQQGTGGSDDMKQSMMTGMDSMQNMQMSGDTDKDFAMMMKIHHQQALDMAQMELAHGKSPAMKAMARKIIAAQKKEIAQLEQWLSEQK